MISRFAGLYADPKSKQRANLKTANVILLDGVKAGAEFKAWD